MMLGLVISTRKKSGEVVKEVPGAEAQFLFTRLWHD
jgi:hypothetical protein